MSFPSREPLETASCNCALPTDHQRNKFLKISLQAAEDTMQPGRKDEYMTLRTRVKHFLAGTFVPVVLAGALAAGPSLGVLATSVDSLRRRSNSTQSQLNAAQSETKALQNQEQQINEELEQKNAQLVENLASIQLLEETIAQLDDQIAEKQKEYDAAKADEEERYNAMKQRIKYMYEQGNATYVQILIKATSFSDMLNKVGYAEELYSYDRKKLEEYQEVQKKVAEVKQQLEEQKSEQEESKRGLEEEQDALQQTVDELKEKNADVSAQIEEAKAAAQELAAQLKAQNAELSAAVEAEAARAEQERQAAAQKAAEEAARQAAQDASKSTDSSTSSSQETETQSSSSESSSSSSGSSSSSSGSSGSAAGQSVANYACQFVGNPYVYGGNSLTEGTDCSGFTSLVYAHFGYSIGRTDVAQRSAGVAVDSLADAQPGDIICYPGHVALYIGNGTIVHASTAATGIKYSAATYRPYVCIRRIIN